jgi:hypothetical protein
MKTGFTIIVLKAYNNDSFFGAILLLPCRSCRSRRTRTGSRSLRLNRESVFHEIVRLVHHGAHLRLARVPEAARPEIGDRNSKIFFYNFVLLVIKFKFVSNLI